MNKTITLTIILLMSLIMNSCAIDTFKRRNKRDKIFTLYEKGKNEDDDAALIQAGKEYQEIINEKIHAQDRLAAVYRTLAERSLAKAQYAYSAKYFTEALKILPNSPYLRYRLGISYMNLTESADTEKQKDEFFERALNNLRFSFNKDNANPNYNAALASLLGIHKDQYEEASKYIENALRINGNNTDYLFVGARIYYSLGDFERSIELYRNIVNSESATSKEKQTAEANMRTLSAK